MTNNRFKIIMREWNLWLVPFDADTEGGNDLYFPEKYYIMPELLELWGHELGWGFKDIDSKNLIKGVDFDTTRRSTVRHVKIAAGAPTVYMKGEPVAVLTEEGKKQLIIKRRMRTMLQKKLTNEFKEQMENGEIIKVGEHSRIVRNALKERFPDIRFRVKSSSGDNGGNVYVYHSILQIKDVFHPKRKEIVEFLENFNGCKEDLKRETYNVGFIHNGKRLIGAKFISYAGSDFNFLTDEQKLNIAKKVFEND